MHPHSLENPREGKSQKPLLNVGLWGFGPAQHKSFVAKNREPEHKLLEPRGMKWLYAHTYREEDELWYMFDRQWYESLPKKCHADSLPGVWDKVKVDPDAQSRGVSGSWGAWALQFPPLGGL